MAKSKIDEFFNDNTLEFEKMPSKNVWEQINSNLNEADGIAEKKEVKLVAKTDNTKVAVKEANVIAFDETKSKSENYQPTLTDINRNYKWLAAAASLLVLIPLLMYFSSGEEKTYAAKEVKRPVSDKIRESSKVSKLVTIEQRRAAYIKQSQARKKVYNVETQKDFAKRNKRNKKNKSKLNKAKALNLSAEKIELQEYSYEEVNVKPSFPGGAIEMLNFIYANMDYPKKAVEAKTQGIVVLNFVVDENGGINNIEISRDIGQGCGEEAAAIVANMPKWNAGKIDGKNVRTKYQLPINFDLEKQEEIFALKKNLKKKKKKKRSKKIVIKEEVKLDDESMESDDLEEMIEIEEMIIEPNTITEKVVQIDHRGKIATSVVKRSMETENAPVSNSAPKPISKSKNQKSKLEQKSAEAVQVTESKGASTRILNGKWNATLIGKGQFNNLSFEETEQNTVLRLYNKSGYELMKYDLQDSNEMGYVFNNNNPFNQSNIIVKVLSSNKIELTFNPPLPSQKNNNFKFKRDF